MISLMLIFLFFIDFIIVINKGNVEKVIVPIATVEICIEYKRR